MSVSRWCTLLGPLAAGALATALATDAPGAEPIPDLSGQWGRDMLFFEPPESGPGPIVKGKQDSTGAFVPDLPCCGIVASWYGDPDNPILKPKAADAVRRWSELSVRGTVEPDLHSNCWPEPPPYVMGLHYGVLILQQKNTVTLSYLLYNTLRRVRLNVSHPKHVTPSWTGDSVGHYEGDTLVIDTIGIKMSPLSKVDGFGTPHSEALHVVERYRLIDGKAAADAQRKNGGKETATPTFGRGIIDPDLTRKGLQIDFTVEDPAVFSTPWSGRVTYRHVLGVWPEAVCAENPHEYYAGRDSAIPQADKPDF